MESSLAPVLSFILGKMVERNDKVPLAVSKRTVFHAEKAPLISLSRYLDRVLSFAPCSSSCYIIALIYIDRIIQSHSDFILNSLSVHRMLITSVMLATKFFDDETFNNLYYAKVGGLQVSELNQLEEKFLILIDFSLSIQAEVFERYRSELTKHAKIRCCSKGSVSPPLGKAKSKVAECPPKICGGKEAPTPVAIQKAASCGSVADCPQSRLNRSAELLKVEDNSKLKGSSIKTLCATLTCESTQANNGVSPSDVLEKKENMWYQSGYDYAARDSMSPPPDSSKYNTSENVNKPLDFRNLSVSDKSFSQPSYERQLVAVTWG